MLEDAKGTNCQSSNFCKAVGVLAQSKSPSPARNSLLSDYNVNLVSNAIDLVDYGREPTELDYAHMIQSFQRFLFEHLIFEGNDPSSNLIIVKGSSYEHNQPNPPPAPITQLVGIDAKNAVTCLHCGATRSKDNMIHIVDLIYPRTVRMNLPPFALTGFNLNFCRFFPTTPYHMLISPLSSETPSFVK